MKETKEEARAKARQGYREIHDMLQKRRGQEVYDAMPCSEATIRAIHAKYRGEMDTALDTLIGTLAEIERKYA